MQMWDKLNVFTNYGFIKNSLMPDQKGLYNGLNVYDFQGPSQIT